MLVLTCSATASCSVLIDKNRVQCTTDNDCRERGPEYLGAICQDSVCQPDPIWGCLGSVVFPRPPVGMFVLTIHMRDLVTGEPIPGVTARLCERPDTTCASPLTNDTPATPSGDLQLPVRGGFDGYIELRAPNKMPGLYFVYPPIDGNREIPFVPLLETGLVEQLAVLNMKQLRADRGHVLLGGYDCRRMPAAGIALSSADVDDQTATFYVLNNLPKVEATATDASGRAGFINLKEGIVAINASLGADGRKIASVSLLIRPGMMTFTSLVPSPR